MANMTQVGEWTGSMFGPTSDDDTANGLCTGRTGLGNKYTWILQRPQSEGQMCYYSKRRISKEWWAGICKIWSRR